MTPIDQLARECGATPYVNRHAPGETAIAFGPQAWAKFCERVAALAELEKQEPVLAMREPSLGGILFAVEQAVKNGCCPFEIEVAFDAYAAECQSELATQRRYASVYEHPPCKGISRGITSSAQKHSPECLAEAAFHQGWSDHDGLDLHVYASLVKKYAAPVAQQPQAEPDEAIIKERDDAEDFIDLLLDEVLGADRPEWTSAYGRADALRDVQERMEALYKPAVNKAWGRFEKAQQPQAEAVPQAAEFCWLVEHFDIANKSTGHYYTGKVGIGDRVLTTMDPRQAQRYDTWRDANNASAKLGSTLTGTWRAMQHGFHRVEPQQAEAVPVTDNWQQYAKGGETAQQCIERHRGEHDSLLTLLSASRAELGRAYRCIQAMHNALTAMQADIPGNGYHSPTIAAAKRFVWEGAIDGTDYFVGKPVAVLHAALALPKTLDAALAAAPKGQP